jgi:hypothetical protein
VEIWQLRDRREAEKQIISQHYLSDCYVFLAKEIVISPFSSSFTIHPIKKISGYLKK